MIEIAASSDKRPTSRSPGSSTSEDEPPNKKRRLSISSLSDADEDDDDDDDEEEDEPLAIRVNGVSKKSQKGRDNVVRRGQRSGKQASSMKSKAQTAPISIPAPTEQEKADMVRPANGINGHGKNVKVEDRLDEGQLTRLATGVTVDAGVTGSVAVTFLYPFLVSNIHLLFQYSSRTSNRRKWQASSCGVALSKLFRSRTMRSHNPW